jgi:hypothetical protein
MRIVVINHITLDGVMRAPDRPASGLRRRSLIAAISVRRDAAPRKNGSGKTAKRTPD